MINIDTLYDLREKATLFSPSLVVQKTVLGKGGVLMMVERSLYFLANGVFMGAQRPLYCMVVPSEFNEPPRKAQTPSAGSALCKSPP